MSKILENAGAACVEVEVVPVELADFITKNTKMITMGMGCGDVCDTQYLFCNDILVLIQVITRDMLKNM